MGKFNLQLMTAIMVGLYFTSRYLAHNLSIQFILCSVMFFFWPGFLFARAKGISRNPVGLGTIPFAFCYSLAFDVLISIPFLFVSRPTVGSETYPIYFSAAVLILAGLCAVLTKPNINGEAPGSRPKTIINRTLALVLVCVLALSLVNILALDYPLRFPDESRYMYVARNIANDPLNTSIDPPIIAEFEPPFAYARGVPPEERNFVLDFLSPDRYLFVLILSAYGQLTSFSPETYDAISLTIYVTLVLATAALSVEVLGSQAGLVATSLIALNPLVFFYSRRFFPDILEASLMATAMFFMFRSLKSRNTSRSGLIDAFLAFVLACNVKLSAILFIPSLLVLGRPTLQQFFRRFPRRWWAWTIVSAVILGVVAFMLLQPFRSHFLLDVVNRFFMTDNLSQLRRALLPTDYPMPVLFLAVASVAALVERRGTMAFALGSPVILFLAFFMVNGLDRTQRFFIPIYPLVAVLATYGLLNSVGGTTAARRALLILLGSALAVVPILSIEAPWFSSGIPFGLLAATSIITVFVSLTKAFEYRIPKRILLGTTLISLVVLSSVGAVTYAFSNDMGVESDPGVREVGAWLRENTSPESIILTNAFLSLPVYCDFRSVMIPPPGEETFLQLIKNKAVQYVVFFTSEVYGVSFLEKYPYIVKYLSEIPPGTAKVLESNLGSSPSYIVYEVQS